MRFDDIIIFKSDRFAIGQELDSGKFYLSIPVSNGLVEYEEHYELTADERERFSASFVQMRELAERCRSHNNDDRLIIEPGMKRGSPT